MLDIIFYYKFIVFYSYTMVYFTQYFINRGYVIYTYKMSMIIRKRTVDQQIHICPQIITNFIGSPNKQGA